MTRARIVIDVPVRPFSLNAERSENRFARGKRVKALRELAKISAWESMPLRGRPLFQSVEIEVQPHSINRQYRQDIGNSYPSAKACIDGFVDAGLIFDDDDKYLTRISFVPHQFGRDAMVFVIVGTLSRGAEFHLAKGGVSEPDSRSS